MAVTLGFLGQPGSDESTLASALRRALSDDSIKTLTVAVAWARFRGLVRLLPELEGFRERGGESTLIVGIDEGGATRPGLLLACGLFDRAYVFHDPAGGTFHPKIYLAEGPTQALLILGSSNATPGGWFNNYEASLEAHFELPQDEANQALAGARQWIAGLLAEEELCLALTEGLVERLVLDRRFNVAGHERRASRRGFGTGPDDDRADGDRADVDVSGSSEQAGNHDRVFGARQGHRVNAPPLSDAAKETLAALEIAPDEEAEEDEELAIPATVTSTVHAGAAATAPAPGGRAVAPVAAWTKVLPRGDAQQQTAAKTNLTANVRLTQAKHHIDWRTWFRHDLFGPANWLPDVDINGNSIERANVPFDVTIGGVSLGTVALEVTHAPHRESGQANHTTVLRWGPLLDTVRAADYTGHTLTLERMSDGAFRLDVD